MKERRFDKRKELESGEEYLSLRAKELRARIADLSWAHQQIKQLERLPSTPIVMMVHNELSEILGSRQIDVVPEIDIDSVHRAEVQLNMPSTPDIIVRMSNWSEVISALMDFLSQHVKVSWHYSWALWILKKILLDRDGNLYKPSIFILKDSSWGLTVGTSPPGSAMNPLEGSTRDVKQFV